jgi:hypothetical protein
MHGVVEHYITNNNIFNNIKEIPSNQQPQAAGV